MWSSAGEVSLNLTEQSVRARAFLVPASVEHSFDASGQPIALLLIERHGARGASLDRIAREYVGKELVKRLDAVPFPSVHLGTDGVMAWCDATLAALGVTSPVSPLSSVGRRVVEYVESHLDGVPKLADAARLVGLSATRLTHLFSTEVGVPFRNYVLWARIKSVAEATRRGANATDAAVEAGFSDSAHLSRTFRGMFGLPPSFVLPLVEIVGSAWTGSR